MEIIPPEGLIIPPKGCIILPEGRCRPKVEAAVTVIFLSHIKADNAPISEGGNNDLN